MNILESLETTGIFFSLVIGDQTRAQSKIKIRLEADWKVIQKRIIDIPYKEGKPQKVTAEKAGCWQSVLSYYINRKLTERGKVHMQPTHMHGMCVCVYILDILNVYLYYVLKYI